MAITWTGILAVEDETHEEPATGDGRTLASGSLRWDTPIPLRWVPADTGEHQGAITVGTITEITRVPDGDRTLISASGTYDHESAAGLEAARLADRGIQDGLSIDLDDFTARRVEQPPEDDTTSSSDVHDILVDGRIRATTQVAIPAIPEAKITEVVGLDQYLAPLDEEEPVEEDEAEDVPPEDEMALSTSERISFMNMAIENLAKEPDAGGDTDETIDPSPDPPASPRETDDTPAGEQTDPRRPDHSSSAMIALRPSDPDSLALPDGLTPSGLHVTLFFLGDADELTDDQLELAAAAAAQAAKEGGPVTGTIAGDGHLGDEDPPADVLLLNGDGIAGVREKIVQAIGEDGNSFPTQHSPFIPHLTLGYGLSTPPSIPTGTEIVFDRLTLDIGDVRTSFEWGDLRKQPRSVEGEDEGSEMSFSMTFQPVPPHGGATVDEPWDGRLMEKRMPTGEPDSYYRQAYAYHTPGTDGTAKDHWRYLHHMVSQAGEVGAANTRACRVMIALMNGARGVELDLDRDEKQAVYNHLANHMESARLEPPTPKFAAAADEDCACSPDLFTVTAAADLASTALPSAHFARISFPAPTPLTVSDSGHVFGHIAPWNACHIGMPNCTPAPRSSTDLAYFHLGTSLLDDDTEIRTGVLTLGEGHADVRLGWRAAVAHYDDASTVFADVIAYEDEHGIAVTGHLRDDLTPAQLRAFRAAKPSGDWRRIGGNFELVGAHMVNTPGYPITHVASGHQQTLIVPGLPPPSEPPAPVLEADGFSYTPSPILASLVEASISAHHLKAEHDADVDLLYTSLHKSLHSSP